jgi:Domain of unknown function (DUF4382)
MSQMTRFAFTGGALLALCAAFSGCSSRTNVSATGSTPSQFTHVYITTQEVWFNTKQNASPDDTGWGKFPLKTPVTIDLITESNGTLGEIINDLRVAPGTYNSILLMPVPVDWIGQTLTASATAVGATYNAEADYVDTAGTAHQVPLVLPNPEKGFLIPGASLKVPVGKVGVGGVGTSSTAGTTNTTTTNVFGSPTTTPATTTPTTSTSNTTTTVSFATSFDGNRDLHLFCYVIASTGSCTQSATGATSGTATGAILSANPTATDLATTGGITGTLTLTSTTTFTNITSVSGREAIQASAELLSADGSHHVIVASAPVQTDGTFTIYPLQSNSKTPAVYDVVIHGPNIFTIIIKNVSVTTTTPSLTGAASTTGSVATTTATGAVSIGTFIPTAASAFVANITPTTTASLPPGAAVTFYQTLPASNEVPYAIDEVGIDPLNLNLQTAEQLSTGAIQSGTYASSGSTITVTSSTPTETTNAKAAAYRVGATAPLYADGALSFSTMVVSNAASLVPAPSTTTTPTAPTPVAVAVPSLTPANSSAAGSIAAAITVPAGSYIGGELIVSHDGAIVGVGPIASSTLLNGTGSVTVNGLPSGDVGNYYVSAILWTSSSFKSESITSPVTVTGGSPTDVAVTLD